MKRPSKEDFNFNDIFAACRYANEMTRYADYLETKQLPINGVLNCKNTLHELKILPQYFWEVHNGNKTFELRKDDRDYKVGDVLKLKEWNYSNYTGNECFRTIKYILKDCEKYGLKKGFVLLAIQ